MAWDAVLFDFEDTLIDLARGRGRGRYFAGMPGVPPVLDARGRPVLEAMVKLAESGVPVAVITSSPEAAMGRWFQEQQLSLALPMTVVGFHDTVLHRPSPHPLLEALHQLGLPPSRRILAVGDSADDIEAARRAGLTTATVRPTAPLSMPPELYFPNIECFFDTEPCFALAGDLESERRDVTLRADLDTHDCRIGGRWRSRPSNRLGDLLERSRHGEWADELVDLAETLVSHALGSVRDDAWLTAVPPHRDESDRLGRLMARLRARTGLRTRPLLRMAHDPGPQTSRTRAERATAMQGCMEPRAKADLTGRTVVVLDDVRTTGATLAEAARALRAAGAARVLAVALAQEEFRSDEVSADYVPLTQSDRLADGGLRAGGVPAASLAVRPGDDRSPRATEPGDDELATQDATWDAQADGAPAAAATRAPVSPAPSAPLHAAAQATDAEPGLPDAPVARATPTPAQAPQVSPAAAAPAVEPARAEPKPDTNGRRRVAGRVQRRTLRPRVRVVGQGRQAGWVEDAVAQARAAHEALAAGRLASTAAPTDEDTDADAAWAEPVSPESSAGAQALAEDGVAPEQGLASEVLDLASSRVRRDLDEPLADEVDPDDIEADVSAHEPEVVVDPVAEAVVAEAEPVAEPAPAADVQPTTPAEVKARYPRAYKRWLPEEDARLVELLREGLGLQELCDAIGRQPSAVESRIRRQGLDLEAASDDDATDDVEVADDHAAEAVVAEAPAEPVAAPSTPAELKARYPRAYTRWKTEEDERLEELYVQGLELQALCDHLGRQPSAVESRIRRLGLDVVELEDDEDDDEDLELAALREESEANAATDDVAIEHPVLDAEADAVDTRAEQQRAFEFAAAPVDGAAVEVQDTRPGEPDDDVAPEPAAPAAQPEGPAAIKARYPRAYTRWEPAEDERLEELHADGLELQALCDALGRQPSAVESRIRRLGLDLDDDEDDLEDEA